MKIILYLCLFIISISAFSQLSGVDSLKLILKNAKHDTTRCQILEQIIDNESDDAIWPTYNNQLKEIAETNLKINIPTKEKNIYYSYLANAFNNIGFLCANNGDLSNGISAYINCIKVQTKIQDYSGIALSFICIGNLHKQTGGYLKAITYYLKAIEISNIIKNEKVTSTALFHLGDVYDNQGNIPESLKYYLKSLKISESISDELNTADCLNNIALIYEKQNDFAKALSYHQKSLIINKKTNNSFGIPTTLNNIGLCYFNMGDLKTAEGYYYKSIEGYEKINAIRNISFVYNNLGNIFLKNKDIKKALLFFNKSLKIRTAIGEKAGIAQSLINISKTSIIKGQLLEAEKTGLSALKISQEIGFPEKILSSSYLLSEIFEKENKGIEALKMHKLYISMRDSLNSIGIQKALITQNTKYEYEKKATADSIKVFEEKKVIDAQFKQEKTQRFALYGGILLVGLFGAFMFNRFKITKKQNHLIQAQKGELQKQKDIVDEHQKETLDSIHYAKRIQNALIANSDFITENIPNNFIFFNPKDIVSGDFYWATKHHNKFYLAVCDSTGHGVPGAFMSLLNMGFLSEAIKEKNIEKPNEIFNYVRERLVNTISEGGQKDGMDGILICIDLNLWEQEGPKTVTYAAANNEPILIKDFEVIALPKDKMPVGHGERKESFSLHSIELITGDALYLYTDGFADQFGGPKGKKFKYKPLNQLLVSFKNDSLVDQNKNLETVFNNWKGNLEQVDDVLIIGIKV